MLQNRTLRALAFALLLLAVSPPGQGRTPKPNPVDTRELHFHARIPLGIIGFFVRPARATLYLMGTVESAEFEGWHEIEDPQRLAVFTAGGDRIHYFPNSLQFRVTATTLIEPLVADRNFLDNVEDLNGLLRNLSFRLEIFHGIEVTTVEPAAVEMIGMPGDVDYGERIYRASFLLPLVPIADRIVLDVLMPSGERLCKFHLEF